MTSYVYAIRCSEFVKFGFSANPDRRLAEMQSHTPLECTIVGVMSAKSKLDEAKVHARFSSHKHRGEWFCNSGPVQEFIASMPLRFIPPTRYLSGRRWYGDRGQIVPADQAHQIMGAA